MPLYVPLAWYGPVKIDEPIRYLYEHRLVQRLRWLSQLNEKILLCPSATQNRLSHSLRVYNDTRKVVKLPEIGNDLSAEIKKALLAFALVHDTPHSPLSHTLEPFFGDHDKDAEKIVDEFKQSAEFGGVDFEIFKALFLHQIPEHKIVSDKNFGTDKFDYLKFDALHTGIGNVPDVSGLKQHLAYRGGQMMAHIGGLEEVKDLQRKYLYGYLHLYCSPETLTWQRLSQKIAQYCFSTGVLRPEEIRWWTDYEFWGAVPFTHSREAQELYQAMKYAQTPVTAIDFLPPGHPYFYENNNSIVRRAISEKYFTEIPQWKSMDSILHLEMTLAGISGLEPWQIILACQDQPEKRFVPTDCTIFNDGGKTFSLFGMAPRYYESLLESAKKSMFIRIAVVEKNPGDAEKAKKEFYEIRKYLESQIDKILEEKNQNPT